MNAISLVFIDGRIDKELSDTSLLPSVIDFHCEKNKITLHVPKNQSLLSPIHFKYLNGCAALQRDVIVEENSKLSLIEEYASDHEDHYTTHSRLALQLNKCANVNYYKIQDENQKAQHEGYIEVSQFEASSMKMFFADCGSNKSRSDIKIKLHEPSASCAMHGLYFFKS